ncbi:MAG: ROK family transcriptional regulator [Chloroflexi bacterium]|nr:ROK family transcriptional regulator [Chloroflexota bacterium]
MKPLKATRENLRRHNRQLLLRAVYTGLADNRAALAQETGLAKPTVSDLIGELISEGLLVEGGLGESTESGGKRPTLIKFVPEARQVIGVSLDNGRAFGVLCNLAGQVVAQHMAELDGAQGDEALAILTDVMNGLIAQLDAPLLCIGVGVPGAVDTASGVILESYPLGWRRLALAERLSAHYEVPVYTGSSAELTALAQYAFGLNGDDQTRNLVTLLVTNSIEVGITLNGVTYHQGGDISALRAADRLDALLGWTAVQQRAADLRRQQPNSTLPETGLTYMHIHYSAINGDPAAQQLCEELAEHLAQVMGWIIGLLRPDHLSLVGPIVNLGEGFLQRVVAKTEAMLWPEVVRPVVFSLAYSGNLSAIGAAALALHRELDIL